MPEPVLVVHDDASTRDLAVAALNAAGLKTAGFADPMAALTALEEGCAVRVLVWRFNLPRCKQARRITSRAPIRLRY
jgi:DNA-binding NtrC family response regulator